MTTGAVRTRTAGKPTPAVPGGARSATAVHRVRSALNGRAALFALVGAVVSAAVVRIARIGWEAASPDDSRYVYVGLSMLAGKGPLTEDGAFNLFHSPAYGTVLAAGSRVVGGDPFTGARAVAFVLSVSALALAVYLAWRLAGGIGAATTAVLLLATPLVWDLVPTLRVDLPQAVCIPIALLLLVRPRGRRWLLAGLVIGIAISVKESALALVLVPLAWLPGLPWRRWLRLAGWFTVGALLTAAWWWIWVWFAERRIWPAPTLDTIRNRGFDLPAPSGWRLWTWVAILAAGVVVCAVRFRKDALGRGVVLTAVLLLPSAWYTLTNDQETRNYVGLAVVSCVATGVAIASLIRAGMRLLVRRPHGRVMRNAFGAAAALVAVALPLGSQLAYRGRTLPQDASASAVGYVHSELKPPARVVSAFRDRSYFGVELRDDAKVPRIVNRVNPRRGLDAYVWVGRRGFTTFGLSRASLVRALGNPAAQFLVVAHPHPLSPAELLPALAGTPAFPEARRFRDATVTTDVMRVNPSLVESVARGLGVHMSVNTALSLLGELGAETLLSARPTVAGDARQVDGLVSRLGVPVCTRPGPTVTLVRLEPRDTAQPCP